MVRNTANPMLECRQTPEEMLLSTLARYSPKQIGEGGDAGGPAVESDAESLAQDDESYIPAYDVSNSRFDKVDKFSIQAARDLECRYPKIRTKFLFTLRYMSMPLFNLWIRHSCDVVSPNARAILVDVPTVRRNCGVHRAPEQSRGSALSQS